MKKELKFQADTVEEDLHKNIVKEVVNNLITLHIDDDLEEAIINGLDDN